MKFSFQTVLVAFMVTLAHLVVLATISPVARDSSKQLVKTEIEPVEEEIESFPVVSEISLADTPEETPEAVVPEAELKEPEAVSLPREEQVSVPQAADLAEVTREESRSLPREDATPMEKSGPHEIRQIAPKPRS